MEDFLGNEVGVGDTVVFLSPNRRSLKRGIVHRITPQGFTIRDFITKWECNRHYSLVVLLKKKEVTNE